MKTKININLKVGVTKCFSALKKAVHWFQSSTYEQCVFIQMQQLPSCTTIINETKDLQCIDCV